MKILKRIKKYFTKNKQNSYDFIKPIVSELNKLSNTLIITNKFNYENDLSIHSHVLKCDISNVIMITNRFDKLEYLTNKDEVCIINLHDAVDFKTIEKFNKIYKCIILGYDKDMRGISPSKIMALVEYISKTNKLNHRPTTLLVDNYVHSFNSSNENLPMFIHLIKENSLIEKNLVNVIVNVNIEDKSWWFANRTLLDILIKREYYFRSNKQFRNGFGLFDLTLLHNVTECLSEINGLNRVSQSNDEDYNELNIYSKILNNFCSFHREDIYHHKDVNKIIQTLNTLDTAYICNKIYK